MVEFISIPVIVVLSYLVGEILKVCFKSNKDLKKLIPVMVTLLGGVIGIIIFLTDKEFLKVSSVYDAILLGLVSGAASTGTKEIIRNIKSKNAEDKSQK